MNFNIRFPKKHVIKSVNPSFDDMFTGKKNFEVLFDPGRKKYNVGDTLIFYEYDYMLRPTERSISLDVSYIFAPEYLLEGFIIVSLVKTENS